MRPSAPVELLPTKLHPPRPRDALVARPTLDDNIEPLLHGGSSVDPERLFVSLGTVKTHVHNLLGKFQVGNRTEAVHRARILGLLSDT